MNLDYHVLLDVESGTFFDAGNAVLIDTRTLTPDELELLNEGSDNDRGLLGSERGQRLDEILA